VQPSTTQTKTNNLPIVILPIAPWALPTEILLSVWTQFQRSVPFFLAYKCFCGAISAPHLPASPLVVSLPNSTTKPLAPFSSILQLQARSQTTGRRRTLLQHSPLRLTIILTA
jgi:hypothetical protein